MRKKLLLDVQIGDVENKYPNFRFNYSDKEDFLNNNIIPSLERVTEESEYDAGYEIFCVNTYIETIEQLVHKGDRVCLIQNCKKSFGKVLKVNEDNEKCDLELDSGLILKNINVNELITIYDFIEQV